MCNYIYSYSLDIDIYIYILCFYCCEVTEKWSTSANSLTLSYFIEK